MVIQELDKHITPEDAMDFMGLMFYVKDKIDGDVGFDFDVCPVKGYKTSKIYVDEKTKSGKIQLFGVSLCGDVIKRKDMVDMAIQQLNEFIEKTKLED